MQWSPALPIGTAFEGGMSGELDARGWGRGRWSKTLWTGERSERLGVTSWIIGAFDFYLITENALKLLSRHGVCTKQTLMQTYRFTSAGKCA